MDRRAGDVYRLAGASDLRPQEETATSAKPVAAARPWRRALCWLLFLGPFFFVSYGIAGWVSAQRVSVGSIVFAWERHVPLLPWTIVPYWSVDVLYALSLFLCRTQGFLDTHARRLLTTQILAVTCFLVAPLRCTFERGEIGGFYGQMFNLLMAFDRPFNQAPSLHIALLVVLLDPYLQVVPRRWHPVVYAWALLIAVSVLTTGQHHFFDLPTGFWLGCFVVWIRPTATSSPLRRARLTHDPQRRHLAAVYGCGALLLVALGIESGGIGYWLLWVSGALALVALIYLVGDAEAFGKCGDGSMPFAGRCLFAPYLLGTWINSRWWTRRLVPAAMVCPGILIGRIPSASDLRSMQALAIVDLCAELPCPTPGFQHVVLPMLDLVWPTHDQINRAVAAIDRSRWVGTVLVCCALGFARSALTVAAWLLRSGLCDSPEAAVARVRAVRPLVVLGEAHIEWLRQWQQECSSRT